LVFHDGPFVAVNKANRAARSVVASCVGLSSFPDPRRILITRGLQRSIFTSFSRANRHRSSIVWLSSITLSPVAGARKRALPDASRIWITSYLLVHLVTSTSTSSANSNRSLIV
ncbi:unnamed protein product, partial [Ectocarpus sp. 12 AP-2014]